MFGYQVDDLLEVILKRVILSTFSKESDGNDHFNSIGSIILSYKNVILVSN